MDSEAMRAARDEFERESQTEASEQQAKLQAKYDRQMRAWAVDRAIELLKVQPKSLDGSPDIATDVVNISQHLVGYVTEGSIDAEDALGLNDAENEALV